MKTLRPTLALLALGLLLGLTACGGGGTSGGSTLAPGTYPVPSGPSLPPPGTPPDPGPTTPPAFPNLTGGVLVTLDTGGEIWHWWVTNPTTAVYLDRAWNGTYTGPFWGRLREGPGAEFHNAPWSWHADPEANGTVLVFFRPPNPNDSPHNPSDCENNLAFWLTRDTLYRPSSYTIIGFDDRRP